MAGFSPLDERLGLLPNRPFSPRLAEAIVRVGTLLPFRQAADLLAALRGVRVDEATVRRLTYAAGHAALALPVPHAAPQPPACLQLSLDATTVRVVGGDWVAVKLAACGALVPGAADDQGQPTARTAQVSYVARWEPAAAFGPTITPEALHRGIDRALAVVSPNDGARWIQEALDLVAPQAVRILDCPHAAEHLGLLAGLVHGADTPAAAAWVAAQRAALLTQGAAPLLDALAACQAQGPCAGARATPGGQAPTDQLAREVAYCTSRAAQLAYPTFRQRGYPRGSGCVESGHRVVTAARLKLAGQQWATPHLNPLLALRCTLCNNRWDATWPTLWTRWRRQHRTARHARRAAAGLTTVPPAPRTKLVVNGRPTRDHPWRRPFLPHPRP